ncbi:hypothetical protein SAMN05444156_0355 [Verrucomicrobium sp. GAS474]|uniref:hypothetical protein n=1 Tax=Verrucomicrobium sp. GAS474 TaxID=1882831 RepID=UPI00087D080B|nr:hypothetical protein [Verrucomicrobium sp. GAS474]SDT87876.1 hypothetical protein SAMN05444156_0355 [Verrucomicrobium sp. GAS474]
MRGDGREFEKNFVSQALQNTYWLRETIEEVAAEETWIHPLVVFTDAFVPYLEPIKGVRVMNKRFLIETLTKRASEPGSSVLWTYAELLQKRLQG